MPQTADPTHPNPFNGLPTLTACGVALGAMGFARRRSARVAPRAPPAATQALRVSVPLGAPLHTTLSFLRTGDATGPCVVLVHGTPGRATAWNDYLLEPPAGTELVALDRPGFGDSGPGGAVPRLAEQAAAVLALVPADTRPVVLVGHSMGAAIVAWAAAVLAAEQPMRAVSLVLVAGSLDPALETVHPLQRLGAWDPVSRLLPRVIRHANTELLALKAQLQELAPLLASVRAPVAIVHGDHDPLVPVANVVYAQQRFTGARSLRTMLLKGKNHFLPWNSETAVREALRGALEAVC